jgi:chitodextrinase
MKRSVLTRALVLLGAIVLGLFGLPSSSDLFAQTPVVPNQYQGLYSQLDADLANFESTISSYSTPTAVQVAYSAELKSAHSNLGPELLVPLHYSATMMELDSLKALGVQAITISVNFPVLDPGFYQDPSNYNSYLNFYTRLASDIRARNLKFIVKTSLVNRSTGYTSLDPGPFYDSLTLNDYQNGRMQMAQTIATTLKPDYLSVITEPDTEAAQSGKAGLGTVDGSTAMLNIILSGLQQTGTSGVQIGAGIGSWTPSYAAFVQSFAATAVDYIDVHVYPVNLDYLPRLFQIADIANTNGKPVAISEAWLTKVGDNELATLPADEAFARDPLSFWAPLDTRFLAVLVKFTALKQALFFSPSWTEWMHGYMDVGATAGLTANQVFLQGSAFAAQQIAAGQYSASGLAYAAMVTAPADTIAPTQPIGLSAVSGGSGITLTWQPATDNVGVAGYNVYRDGAAIGTTAAVYYNDANVDALSTHRYQIAAYDVAGNVSTQSDPAWGAAQPQTTARQDKKAPDAPKMLLAQTVSASQITLTWTTSAGSVAVKSYGIYRNGNPVGMTSNTTYNDTGLTPATTYTYTIIASDASGNASALSLPASATTFALDVTPPSVPQNVRAKAISGTSVAISWSAATDNSHAVGYALYRGAANGAIIKIATTAATQYVDTTVKPGTTYYYAVVAFDKSGNASAPSLSISITTPISGAH